MTPERANLDAAPAETAARDALDELAGLTFYKLTGSGNDFVFFNVRGTGPGSTTRAAEEGGPTPCAWLAAPLTIAALCDRRNGVGADGVVLLDAPATGAVRIVYYNRDGSRASLCGNATLCAARLATVLGLVAPDSDFVVETDAGPIPARVPGRGDPEIQLGAVSGVTPEAPEAAPLAGEHALGFALAGVPHLVVRVDDADAADVLGRGAALRAPTPTRPGGANVNFVSGSGRRWRMRTFERGVEGETLACGTGAVASAALIAAWTGRRGAIELLTSSGRTARVTVSEDGSARPTLAGEGRLVYRGQLGVV